MNPSKSNQKWKVQALDEEVNSNEDIIPFLVVTESHLDDTILDAEVQIKNYDTIRSDRINRMQGGTILYLHQSITVDEIQKFSDGYVEAVMVHLKKSKLIIASIYRAPNTPKTSFSECLKTVNTFIEKHKNCDLLLMGDYNFRFVDWQTEAINKYGIPVEEQEQAIQLISFSHKHLLTQVVEENTRKDYIIDLIFITDVDMIHNISVEKVTDRMTDHNIVKCCFTHKSLQSEQQVTPRTFQQKHPLDNLNIAKADWTAINEELEVINWDSEMENSSVEEMYQILENHIIDICTKHTPVRTRITNKYKIPNKRLALIRRKKRLNSKINCRKFVRENFPENLIQKLEKKKAEVEEEIRKSIVEEKESKEIKAIEQMKSNPKMFYTYMKKFSKSDSKIGPLADDEGNIHSDAKAKAEILQKQYTKVFSNPDNASTDHLSKPDELQYPTLEDIEFTMDDVKKAIDSIPNFAAPGPDKLPATLLKSCKEQLAYPIYKLWRKSLDTGDIPEVLKDQGIIPIFKKGNKSLPANYRPVSLTSHLIKLFGKVLRIKLVEYIESNNILTENQHGFRPHRNCLTQLLVHIDNILEKVGNEFNIDVVYLDFAKAFDKVDHKILLQKLQNIGIQGKIYRWIKSFLSNRKQRVIVDGEASESAEVKSGVPQGTVLGPILFLIFINDISEAIEFSDFQLFADDSKISKEILNEGDHQKLQSDIDKAIMWSLLNNMELNIDKFQLLQYGSNNELKQEYSLNDNNSLKSSSEVKDLGVTVSDDLSWLKHITNITNIGKKFTGWILRCFRTRSTVLMSLFKTFVISRIEYACPLWQPFLKKDIEKIESLQRTFTSKLNGLEEFNYHERLRALDLYSLQRRRERFCIITVWKILNNLHPNQIHLEFYETRRFGMKCRSKIYRTRKVHIRTLQYNSFAAKAPALFNCIPRKVKEKESLSSFKAALDKFLKTIPDTPPISGYQVMNGNSIVEWAGGGGHYQTAFDREMSVPDGDAADEAVTS